MPFKTPEDKSKYNKNWFAENPEKQKIYRENRKIVAKRQRNEIKHTRPCEYIWRNARSRAYRSKIPFDIEIEDIVIPERCPILDIPLFISEDHNRRETSPSLDRVDNNQGYIKGNVRVISWRANRLKSDLDIPTLKAILKYMET